MKSAAIVFKIIKCKHLKIFWKGRDQEILFEYKIDGAMVPGRS